MDFAYDDLQAYLVVLWRWKWMIVICMMLAAAAAAVVTYVTPPTYEASVLVVLTRPIYVVHFDPSITSGDSAPWTGRWMRVGSTYELLAKDPALVQQLIDTLGEALATDERTPQGLNGRLEVREVSEEGVVHLVGKHTDPGTAQLIADTWGRLYAERLNRLYGQTTQDLTVLATQLEAARKNLDTTQAELAEFHQRSRLPALQSQLTVRRNKLDIYLSSQDRLDLVIEDVQFLRTQLQKTNAPGPALSTQLALLYLELEALNVGAPTYIVQSGQGTFSWGSSPIVLQMPVDQATFAVASPADQLHYLDGFITAAQAKRADIDAGVTELEREIASLKSEVETESAALNRLTLARDVAFETFSSLSRESEEVRVSVELGDGIARTAGPAIRPESPVSPGLLRNVGLGAVGGLLLGVGGAFALEFIRRWPKMQPVDKKAHVIGET